MEELQTKETSQLLDMLSSYTADYTKMLAEGIREGEYAEYKLLIKAIQAELDLRKKEGINTPDPGTNITSPPEFT